MIWQTRLEIDFGEVGYWRGKERFHVSLGAAPLIELIGHARQAHRVYELSLITRPGDVWDYLTVTPHALPETLERRVADARRAATPAFGGKHPWPAESIPFLPFDQLFQLAWADNDPADEAWLGQREGAVMRAFSAQLLAMARSSLTQCEPWCREIHEHERERIRAGSHPRHFMPRKPTRFERDIAAPNAARHSEDFYGKLEELLRDPELAAVAYRGGEDYRVFATLACEQRRRARLTGHAPEHCVALSAWDSACIHNEDWGSHIRRYEEGLGQGDLLIAQHFRDLIEQDLRVPQRAILSMQGEGPLSGYTQETGEGWVLYRKQAPITRRDALLGADLQHSRELGPVLCFGEQGPALLSFENARFVLGEAVSLEVREQLASILAEWEQHGGMPQVFAQGDVSAFLRAGCQRVFAIPPDALQLTTLDELLTRHRRWTDALFALDCPTWMNGLFARHHSSGDPWKTWIVRTGNSEELPGDLILPVETLAARLGEAWQQAKQYRPS